MKHTYIKEEPLPMKIIDAYFIIRTVTTLVGVLLYYTGYFYLTKYGLMSFFSFMFEDLTIYAVSPLIPLLHALAFGVAYWGLKKDIGIVRLLAVILLFMDVFAFPVGTIMAIAMIIYLVLPSTARFFTPIAKKNIHYRAVGLGILVFSLVGFVAVSDVAETIIPTTEEPLPMLAAADKIIDIDVEGRESVDVIIEMLYTTSMMQAVDMQSVVLQDVQLLGGDVLGSTYKTVNAINAEIDVDRLLELAANPNVKRIIRNEPVVKLQYMEGTETGEYVLQPVIKLLKGNITTTGEDIVVAIVDSGINEDMRWLQRGGRSVVIDSFELHGDWVHWHGTAVASCIASQHPEYLGVAPGVDLLDVEVFLPSGRATYFDIIKGWEWVVDWKQAHPDRYVICSNSLGVPATSPGILDTAADNIALRYGIPMVVAAGNEHPQHRICSPGMGRYVLTVGAVDFNDIIADFSCRGPVPGLKKPDVCALGVNVHTFNPDNFMITPSGTSFSTPIVAGALALLVENNQDYSVGQLYDAIRNGAKDAGVEGFDYDYGYGIADLEGAERALAGEKPSRYYLYMFALMPFIALAVMFYPELDKLLALY